MPNIRSALTGSSLLRVGKSPGTTVMRSSSGRPYGAECDARTPPAPVHSSGPSRVMVEAGL